MHQSVLQIISVLRSWLSFYGWNTILLQRHIEYGLSHVYHCVKLKIPRLEFRSDAFPDFSYPIDQSNHFRYIFYLKRIFANFRRFDEMPALDPFSIRLRKFLISVLRAGFQS